MSSERAIEEGLRAELNPEQVFGLAENLTLTEDQYALWLHDAVKVLEERTNLFLSGIDQDIPAADDVPERELWRARRGLSEQVMAAGIEELTEAGSGLKAIAIE